MRKKLIYLVLIFLILIAHLKIVSAYIDPGTGGMIVTSMWSVILTVLGIIGAFFVKFFFRPIKKAVLAIWKRIKTKQNKYHKNSTIKLILFIFLISIVLIFYFISIEKEVNTENMKYKKVLVLGIDGMDYKIINRLMSEEKLPNFKKLAEQGSFIHLNTSNPPQSPVAWTSIATGVNPGEHNIFDFVKRNPENYSIELSISTTNGILGTKYVSNIKAEPFWKITSKANLPTTLIRWPNSFPPEKIKGNMLSGEGVPDIKGFMNSYSFYTEKQDIEKSKVTNKVIQVTKNNNLIETELFGPKTKKAEGIIDTKIPMKIILQNNSSVLIIDNKEYRLGLNKWSDFIKVKFKIGIFKEVHAIFKAYLINTEPFEMFLTSIQIDPENPIVEISYPDSYSNSLAEEIGTYYTLGMPEETDAYVDKILSEKVLLEQVNDIEEQRDKMFWKEFNEFKKKETGVYAFVYDSSDRLQHLFWDEKSLKKNKDNEETKVNKVIEDYYTKKDVFIAEILNKLDNDTLLIIISDHGFTSFEKSVSINTWLVENNFIELTKELSDEEMLLFQYVDWEKTRVYSLGFNSVYVNLKGREEKGSVEEKDKEKIVNEIIEKLENLTDKETGKKVVNKAYKREEIYKGEYIENAPDIIIGFNPGYRMSWQTAVGGFTKEVLIDNTKEWKGDHLVDPKFVPGVLFSNAKLNKKGAKASQLDVAPTVLDALGIEIPENMDGKSLLG